MIKSLQALRGVFAFMIFLHHVPVFPAGGDWGVSFFLVISGFLLARRYSDDLEGGSFDHMAFVRRRVSRIYPLHWLCLFVFFAFFAHFSLDNGRLVMLFNILLLQSWVPSVNYYFSYYPEAWFLSVIVFCYALFPVVAKGVLKASARRLAVWAVGVVAVYLAVVNALGSDRVLPLVYISPAFRCLDVIVGVVLYRLLCGRRIGALSTLGELAMLALMALFVLVYAYVPERYALASYWWVPSVILIAAFAADGHGAVSRLLSSRPMVAFGNMSFYFYMSHGLVLQAYNDFGGPTTLWALIPGCFVASVLLAAVLERIVDGVMRMAVRARGAK